jgi:amino acid adenylation domain-containing protein
MFDNPILENRAAPGLSTVTAASTLAPIHEQIDARAAQHPARTALCFENQTLSYGDLVERSNHLAAVLRQHCVRPNQLVAVLVERSPEMIVALLGVLKAGGAYVPLDPSHPVERIAGMLSDSEARIVLTLSTQAPLIQVLQAQCPTQLTVLAVDALPLTPPVVASASSTPALPPADQHLAYVIYTSGSTGKPKGVMVQHSALSNFIASMAQRPGLDEQDVLLAITTISFDIAGLELWLPLTQGARLHLLDRATVRDVERLLLCIEEVRPTIMQATPSLWTMLFLAGWRNPQGLRALCGGEAMPDALKQRFIETGTQAWNMYGPTETTIWSAQDPVLPNQPVRLGSPIANTGLHVLDAALNPVAPGAEGELCISGAGVALGYWRRPELTAEKFIQQPALAAGRIYRTNDQVRLSPDGSLEYLGRMDFQVKIRGYRVELGEVEAMLMQHPAVMNAVVITRPDPVGNQRLLAFVIVAHQALQNQSHATLIDNLQRHMQSKAPDYMRPAAMTILPQFPLTTNGKIDRRALPEIDSPASVDHDFEAPQTPQETLLCAVWGEQLGISNIGRNAHFFNLGGHSLHMVNIMLALRQRGLKVEIRTLYQYPLLSELAAHLPPLSEIQDTPSNAQTSWQNHAAAPTTLSQLPVAEQAVLAHSITGGAANIEAAAPLGAMQKGILFQLLAHPESDPFVLWQVLRFADVSLLHAWIAALQASIARHPGLRIGIVHQGLAQPLQVVVRNAVLPVETITGADALAQLQQRTHAPRFDLSMAPLQRCTWCHDSESGEWVLLHQWHHLAMDHVTEELLQQEIEARLSGRAPGASDSPVAAAISVLPEQSASAQTAHKAFFDQMLSGYEPIPAPLGATQAPSGPAVIVQCQQRLPEALAAAIRTQARAHGVGAAALFHLAWAKVLSGLSGSSDVVFGTVLLGRLYLGENGFAPQTTMGQFINTLPIRLSAGQDSVLDSLWHTQQVLSDLVGHEQAALALAQKSAQLPANVPLFSALLNYRHSAINRISSAQPFHHRIPSVVPGIYYSGINERTSYAITLNVDDLGQDFVLNVQLEQGQDPQRLAAWMASALESITTALANAPGTAMGRLHAMPEAERTQLLQGWNQTAAAFPDQASLHELIQAQVARTPVAIALEFGAQRLSYAELNRQANQLARHLVQAYGARPDSLIGICAERSTELVIALLAVLKAGAAYVPLDPHYPDERLAYMLRDAAPLVVLSHGSIPQRATSVLQAWQSEAQSALLDLEADRAHWSHLDSSDLPANPAAADHLAYVIYTSGSTGQPKGVMNAHRGVVNRLVWMQKAYRLSAADAVLQKTPFSFDVSVWEFFWPLMYGARLVLAKPEGHKDPHYLSEVIASHAITTLHFVPSMLSAFLDHGTLPAQTSLRQVFCSGEALPAASVRRFFERFDQVELHNLYGPTEAAIDVTAWDCRHSAPAGVVPIGYPIDNIRIHILDPWGEPCPVGVAGELHIAGVGVARGYWGRTQLSAEKFINDPFHAQGISMYRTGDLARYLPDGAIEYLGRNDFQVKLRGFRIELGEIENALLSHAAIKECVVLLRQDSGEPRLVAYLTRTSNALEAGSSDLSDQALRQHLLQTLPAFMLPAHLVWLETLPVTANGKLDRKALPAPLLANATASGGSEQSGIGTLAEGTQTRLAEVWAKLLEHQAIGPATHFYEAGGHSLLAVALMSAIGLSFGVNLPLSTIITHLELADLAGQIEIAQAHNDSGSANTSLADSDSNSNSDAAMIRALPVQTGIYKAVRLDPHDLSNNSFVALGFDAEPDLKQLRNVLQMVFERHQGLRARFVLEQDELFLKPAARFMFRLEKRQTLGSLEQDLRDFVRPISLDDGMNVQGRWIIDSHTLLLNFSHAVVDGSALAQLLEELATASQPGAALPDVTSLAAYSRAFYGPDFAGLRHAHDDYWRSRLQGWQSGAPVATAAARTASWQFSIAAEQKNRIDAVARQLQISLPEFFMGLFLQLKARLEQQSDQLASMIFHGRDQLIQQSVLGPLMTVLPVRVEVSPQAGPDLRTISQAMRTACRHYLFDAATLASSYPELARDALFPAAFFGYFQHDGFTGEIAGQACRQLDTPVIAGAQAHWKLSCEIAEHAERFEIRLEALDYRASAEIDSDWQSLMCTLLEQVLSGIRLHPHAQTGAATQL